MSTFKERLQQVRKERRFSQDQLAQKLGKSGKAVISSWEIGKAEPSLSDLIKLAENLEVASSWLLDGVGDSSVPTSFTVPKGYSLVENEELIAMQRELLQCREKQAVIG